MSTFAELTARVEETNSNLMLVRDAIVEESIDQTSSLIDVLREGSPLSSGGSATENLKEIEGEREAVQRELRASSFLESILFEIQGMHKLMKEKENQTPPDWAKFALAEGAMDMLTRGPTVIPTGGGGKDKTPKPSRLKGFATGLAKRGPIAALVGLFANELLMFFFDKTLADMPKILAEKTRELWADFKAIDWSQEWEQLDIGESLNRGINNILDVAFGKGTLESGFERAGLGATIGFMLGGPMGALITGALGMASGLIRKEDAQEWADMVGDWFEKELKGIFDMVTFGFFRDPDNPNKPGWDNFMEKGRNNPNRYTDEFDGLGYEDTPSGSNRPKSPAERVKEIEAQLKMRLGKLDLEMMDVNIINSQLNSIKANPLGPNGTLSKSQLNQQVQLGINLIDEQRDVDRLKDEIADLKTQMAQAANVVSNTDNSVQNNVKVDQIPIPNIVLPHNKK